MFDLYLEKVQGVKWYVVWETGFIFQATREAWGWSSSLNLYMRSKIRAHIVHLLIQLNKFDPNPPEIILYIYIYIKLFLTKCASSFIFCFSKFYVYLWKRRAISFITKMALLSLMYLGRWRTVTHCWYQWTTDDHFIYQSFSNSGKGWEVGITPLGQASHILLEGRIFLQDSGNLRRSDFDHSNLFQTFI